MLRLVLLVIAIAISAEGWSQDGRGPQLVVQGGGSSFGRSGGSFQGVERQTVTFTVRQTVDVISSQYDLVYNTLPVINTDFRIVTHTVTTWQVVQTPGNQVVRVSTQQENRPTTIQVTDTNLEFRFATNVATDTLTVTHTRRNVDFITVTSTVHEQLSVTAAEVRTKFQTDYSTTTVARYSTKVVFVRGYY